MVPNETAVSLAQTIAKEIAPRAEMADKMAALPVEDVRLLQKTGYTALSVPKEFGGYGYSLLDCVAAQVQLAQGSGSTAMVAAMPIQVFGLQREDTNWRKDAYEQLCTAAAQGALINSVASEPEMGSPSRGGLPATTAVPTNDGSGWLLNGRKTWVTGGEHLTHLLVYANVGNSVGIVVVEKDTPGLVWEHTWKDALSLRASDSHDVCFENVVVPLENLIDTPKNPQPNVWFPLIMASVYMGTAVAARNAVIQFALERVPSALGKPISTLPKIQRQIGEIDIALQAAQALLFDVAGEWTGKNEDREAFLPRIAAAKSMVTETANKVTDKALRIAGGTSITKALPLERYFRDVRAGSMQPPSGDTALEMVGRAAIAELAVN
ncbi:MAG: acyl-CoA/acyl-ACP dehydrogenase [Anaerolineae bacterium]|nr:acyl-CoA/acyl-ACP dehydrogenase [Anaerolineae bacterium]